MLSPALSAPRLDCAPLSHSHEVLLAPCAAGAFDLPVPFYCRTAHPRCRTASGFPATLLAGATMESPTQPGTAGVVRRADNRVSCLPVYTVFISLLVCSSLLERAHSVRLASWPDLYLPCLPGDSEPVGFWRLRVRRSARACQCAPPARSLCFDSEPAT